MKRIVLPLLMVLVAGCSGDDSGGLSVDDPWGRPTPDVATTAAFFATISNAGTADETLVGATTDACRVIELHESQMDDGVMRMQQLAGGIPVPAGTTVVLQPGGLHIMCIDKQVPLVEGDEVALALEFVDGDGERHTESITAAVEDR
ncbi:MAG: copper chaperone PCu(A)C [Acidimicrobiia bacterium]|nr:copper chaperone PCu(A)C [Acidimicrobiia bacterium]NNL70644.1 copper chaperone PCu(A)C [Acidimicrobiia bacterium]